MSRAYYTYTIDAQQQADQALACLRDHYTLKRDEPRRWQRRFLDTFDWRLYRDGATLEQHPAAEGACLILRDLGSFRMRRRMTLDQPPCFASDLPPGAFRQSLEPLLEMRALLPVATVHGTAQALSLMDDNGKRVLRMVLERPARATTPRLLLFPVRGFGRDLKRIRCRLEQCGLRLDTGEPMLDALAGDGRVPGYTGKLDIALQSGLRADVAVRRILERLLDIMLANEAGLRGDVDSEFLHDFRAAVRRTRSALGQIKGVLPSRTMQRFRREFAWLGQITGATRDLDVYLLQFGRFRARLPQAMRNDLDPLRGFMQRRQQLEHRRLVQALDSARYRRLVQDWRRFLQSPPPGRPRARNARRPIVQVAGHRIRRLHRRVLNQGRAITPDTPCEVLHDLRKTCKKLRYLMEFFRSLYPADALGRLIKALSRLQDNLGELQDLEVQSAAMLRLEALMDSEQTLAAGTRAATEWLVGDLEERKQGVRGEFAPRFHAFARPRTDKRFRSLFGPDQPKETNGP